MNKEKSLADLKDTSNQTEFDNTIDQLLTAENFTKYDGNEFDSNGMEMLRPEIDQSKHLMLESNFYESEPMLNYKDEDIGANDGSSLSYSNDNENHGTDEYQNDGLHKQDSLYQKIAYDNILSPISLSSSSPTDDTSHRSAIESKSLSVGNEFIMNQVKETKKRIINSHKLILNFKLLKDSYNKTCQEFEKSTHNLRESEIQRAYLYQENEKLRRIVIELNGRLNHQ